MAATNKKSKSNSIIPGSERNIRGHLTLATCSLLTAQQASAQSFDNDWVSDIAYMTYQEADDRISVNKLIANVNGNLSDANRIKVLLIVDSMTGSTPTGGLPSVSAGSQVSVTGTSGGGFSTGGTPLALAPFDDTRLAVNTEWEHDHSRTLRMSYGASISVENDYNSFGGSVNLAKDDAARINTFTTGIAFTSDRISQLDGQTPGPLSDVNDQTFFDEGERTTMDLIFGYSRVLSAKAVYQVNASFNSSKGYHTDPYKVVSIANSDDVEASRIYESRPRERSRTSLYNKLVLQTEGGDNMHISYRYYSDDWEVTSHTVQFSYRLNFNNGHYFEPSIRAYGQDAADFYVRTLPIGGELPEFVSGDNRLAEMTTGTLGLKYAFPLSDGGIIRFRLDYVSQSFEDAIIDTNEAIIFQVSFRKVFE